jgi:radical SAM superfamily enzyme YgiQ (UPF0313 family)
MSHLGLRILYSVLNRRDDMLLERCFAPWPDMEQALRDSGIPLHSLETRTPLSRFDVVGFSLQYELSFTNVLMMLDLAGIPFYQKDRDERHPLVIGGGPVVFSPEPVADFFDLFLIGDGEEVFPRLLETSADLRDQLGITGRAKETRIAAAGGAPAGTHGRGGETALRGARLRILEELARLPGVYVPSLYRTEEDPASRLHFVAGLAPSALGEGREPPPFPVRRAVLDDLNRFPVPADTIVPHAAIVHDRVSIELARGCTEGCRFCQAGTIYRPVRERSTESIINSALDGLEKTGYDEVSLTSLSPADYSCLPDLVERMMDRMVESRVGLSISSLRPYGLTESLAKQISRVKKSGFTIAPEAGTQRLRDVLNKGITEEHILQAAHNAFGEGWDLIKTYFMIGLPTETEEDLLAMLDLCGKILRIGRRRLSKENGGPGGRPRLHFSASSHVPKPHAPFQWARMGTAEELYGKQRFLAARLRNPNVRLKRHHVETSILECVMSRGDRRLAPVIETAYRKGCRFDGWTELFRWQDWQAAFDEHGIGMEPFLAEIPLESTLPWDHIDTTVLKEFLIREWKQATKAKVTPPCEKPYRKFNRAFRRDDKLVCYDCGCECNLPHIREERVANHEQLLAIRSMRAPLAAAPVEAPSFKYRAVFHKGGHARFLSHLDLNRAFGRAFRRAGIRLKYSQGFTPKPLLAFTPALALGAVGMREAVDFQLGELIPVPALAARLNEALPEGVDVRSVSLVKESDPSLSADVTAARYRVTLPLALEAAPLSPGRKGSGSVDAMPFNEESGLRSDGRRHGRRGRESGGDPGGKGDVEFGGDPAWHRERVAAFNEASSRTIEKVRKGRMVKVDLKQFAGRISCNHASEADGVALEFSVTFRNGATVRPEEVLMGIYGFVPRDCAIVREGLEFSTPSAGPGLEPHAVPAAPAAG